MTAEQTPRQGGEMKLVFILLFWALSSGLASVCIVTGRIEFGIAAITFALLVLSYVVDGK